MISRHTALMKRAFDLAASAIGLVLAAPVALGVAALIRWRLGPPVLFRQLRPGLGGKPFVVVKFRTMRNVDPARGHVTEAERATRIGNWLRGTSLDELPSLWNVLRGDMSIVGPRPLLMEYLDRYSPEEFRRHAVRPGITGLAQVRGRNCLTWPERFAADLEYVDNLGLGLDLRILLATAHLVVRRRGVTDPGVEPLFTGTRGVVP